MSNINVYTSPKLDLYDNWVEFKEFFKSFKDYASWWFYLNILALIFLVFFPFLKNPSEEGVRYLSYMLKINKEDPYYFHMMLFSYQLAKPVIMGIAIVNYYYFCLIIAFFLRPVINLFVQIIYQSFVDKNPDEYVNIKNHYHSIFNEKIKPKLRSIIFIPSALLVIYFIWDIFKEYQKGPILSYEYLKTTSSKLFIVLVVFALLIEVTYWIFMIIWRKKEINTLYNQFDIFLFSKYTIKDKFKSFLSVLLFFGILIHYLFPLAISGTDTIKEKTDRKFLEFYTKKYNEYYEEHYSTFDEELKNSFIDFGPDNMLVQDLTIPNPFESVKNNQEFKKKAINSLFYLFIYIGILNLTINLILKLYFYRKYALIFLNALINSIKYCSIFTLIGIMLSKFFAISMSNPLGIGNMFLILVSFLLSIGQYEDFTIATSFTRPL